MAVYTVSKRNNNTRLILIFLHLCPALSLSGPAVRYNAEFNKRIPVTGLGGSSDLIIIDDGELISKM